ncbi:MAG TPA: hypothetical protein PLD23_09855 [Armatimonadota bacterium]|nr:hypothetical protein [Armatimonadota bacterium]
MVERRARGGRTSSGRPTRCIAAALAVGIVYMGSAGVAAEGEGLTVPAPGQEGKLPSYVRPASPPPAEEAPKLPRIAILPFGNQTKDAGLAYLEQGIRVLLQGMAERNTGVDLVTARAVDRAIRRHGMNPARGVPLTEARAIAEELGCAFIVGGFFHDVQEGYCLRGLLFRRPSAAAEADEFVWPLEARMPNAAAAVQAAADLWAACAGCVSLAATQTDAQFWTGYLVKLRVITDSDRVMLSLADPGAARVAGLRYNVVEGRQVSAVEVEPAPGGPGRVLVASDHPEGSRRRAVVDVHLVIDASGPGVSLRVDKQGEGQVQLEFYNENSLGEPRLTQTVAVDAVTSSTQFRLDLDPLRRDGPTFALVVPFGPEEGSVALATPAPAPQPATEPPTVETGPGEATPAGPAA